MEYLVAFFVMTSVALLVVGVGSLVPARGRVLRQRLDQVRTARTGSAGERRTRQERRKQLESLLGEIGERMARDRERGEGGKASTRAELIRAGYYGPSAVPIYKGARIFLSFALGGVVGAVASMTGASPGTMIIGALVFGLVGWILPRYVLKRQVRRRQKELQKALADALDLLVVCVEAGLGLNQALVRVSEEIGSVSRAMSQELGLVNLEIRAGTPREEALRHLGERTDLPDLRALTAMLIQTDRFGTSVSRALRVHSETMRTKRRQRAEEAAAKTTIKLVFPLVLFIFPAMFVVILGPAIMHIVTIMKDVG